MPTVRHIRVQQGYRPFTRPRALMGLVRGRGMRGLGAAAICLDQNENSIPCADPGCTYGDCNSTGAQQTSGPLCLDSAQNQIACSDPACTYGDCSGPSPLNPSPVAAGAPTGAVLTYFGQWPITLTQSADTILGQVKAMVQAHGLQVTSTNYQIGLLQTAPFAVQIQMLVTGSGFERPQDAGSIVDNAFYQATNKMPASSQTSVATLPSSPSSTGSPGSTGGDVAHGSSPQNFTLWLEQNAMWLGLAVVAIAVLPNLIKKL